MKKTGFIAILGRPNVGKSTLLNAILGEKIAIVSKKPQTTRNRITGILSDGEDQIVFLDTPGMHTPKNQLGGYMVKAINSAIGDVDAAVLVVEADKAPGATELCIIEKLKKADLPCVLVINKTDRTSPVRVGQSIEEYSTLYDFASVVPVSAMKGDGVSIVVDECRRFLYESDWLFPDDIVTDQPERQIVAETIREKIIRTMDEEVPHGTAVVIEEFKEKKELLSVRATIYCERDSHKRILIGKGGSALKTIGSYAREDLEKFFGCKVFLDLWVKVKENWRDSNYNISDFGFKKDEL